MKHIFPILSSLSSASFFILSTLLSGTLSAQTITVRDRATLQPLDQVEISTGNGTRFRRFVTDRAGQINLTNVADTTTLTIRRVGYQPLILTPQQAGSGPVLLTEKYLELNEVVVAASRLAESQTQVTQPIRVFTRAELRFLNQPTMAEVLQQSGHVLVQKSQLGGGSPILRGFEANKILIVVDGIRMNNAIYRGGHLQNILTLDNAAVDRLEIGFGPGSVAFGSDALGGVIYVKTISPTLATSENNRLTANGFVRYGTAMHEKVAHADWNIGGKRWAALTSLTASDFGDLRQGRQRNDAIGTLGIRPVYAGSESGTDVLLTNPNPTVQVPSGYKQIDVLQKVLFQPNARTRHLLNLQGSTSTDIPRYDRLSETTATGGLSSAEWYYGPQKRLLTGYDLTKQFTSGLADELHLIVARQFIEESRHNRRFGNYNLQNRTEQVTVWTLNADLQKKLTDAHTLRYGLEVTDNAVRSTAYRENRQTGAIATLDTRYPDGGAETQSVAGYVTGTYAVSNRSTLTYGTRYAWNRLSARFIDRTFFPFPFDAITQESGAATGSLGWVTKLSATGRVSASLSSGYRVPNVDDLAKVFESVAGQLIVPNPGLKPERTYTVDLGVRKEVAGRLTVSLDGFYTLYTNAITAQPALLNGEPTVPYNGQSSRVVTQQNAQRARVYGTTAEVAANLTQSLTLFGTLTYTRGRILTDSISQPLDHIPPLYGKAGLRFVAKKIRAEINVLLNGAKPLSDYNLLGEDNITYATPTGMPGWQTINLRGSYQLNRYVQIQAALENILDRNYRVFASGISAPGRNVTLTLRGTL